MWYFECVCVCGVYSVRVCVRCVKCVCVCGVLILYSAPLINHTHGGGVGAESGWHKAVEEVKEGAQEFADDTAAAGMMQCVL